MNLITVTSARAEPAKGADLNRRPADRAERDGGLAGTPAGHDVCLIPSRFEPSRLPRSAAQHPYRPAAASAPVDVHQRALARARSSE